MRAVAVRFHLQMQPENIVQLMRKKKQGKNNETILFSNAWKGNFIQLKTCILTIWFWELITANLFNKNAGEIKKAPFVFPWITSCGPSAELLQEHLFRLQLRTDAVPYWEWHLGTGTPSPICACAPDSCLFVLSWTPAVCNFWTLPAAATFLTLQLFCKRHHQCENSILL